MTMTDKETTQWFDSVLFSDRNRPMILTIETDTEQQCHYTYVSRYSYVVVNQEELERSVFYKSERHGVSLIRRKLHLDMITGDSYVNIGVLYYDSEDINVCEGTGLLCITYNQGNNTQVLMYDIRHGLFVFMRLLSYNIPGTEKIQDRIRESVDNNKDITARQMCRQLAEWGDGTSLFHIYDTKNNWDIIDKGYLSSEGVEVSLVKPAGNEGLLG
jgi:hypothetical protein